MSSRLPVYIKIDFIRLLNRTALPGGTERATSDHYEIRYAPNVNPDTVECRYLADGTVWLIPLTSIAGMKLADESVPKYQPVGTHENYDTPTGQRKHFQKKK